MTSNLLDYESHMQSIKVYLEERLQVRFYLDLKNVIIDVSVVNSLQINFF